MGLFHDMHRPGGGSHTKREQMPHSDSAIIAI